MMSQANIDSVMYINVDTQTSFSSTDDDSNNNNTEHREAEVINNTNRLETIEERLRDDSDDEEAAENLEYAHNQHEQQCEIHRNQTISSKTKQYESLIEQQQQQLTVLRDLLRMERQKNHQRKLNNNSMQQYLAQLQSEYLGLQRELVETLELGHKMKAQKEAQIYALDQTVTEKDRLIEQLRNSLSNLDEPKVRAEFNELMEKQNKLALLEREQLKVQIENAEQQLTRERVNNSQILQQFQTKLEELMKSHESETQSLKRKLGALETDYEKLLNEPENLVIRNLKEEKSRLSCQLDELSLVLNESQGKYETLRKRIEALMSEQESIESKNHAEMEQMQQHCVEQRRAYNDLKLELEDRDEVIQLVQFNLQRSEKRVKSLLNAMKGKEDSFKALIEHLNIEYEQKLDKLSSELQSTERKLMDCQSELQKKQNEVIKLELERENQLESIRNDRDERIVRLNQDKVKLEKDLQTMELKLAHETEDKECKTRLIEKYKKDLQYFKEESKRLSIELTKTEAKLFSKQKELNNISGSKDDLMQHERVQQFEDIKLELDEARRHSKRLSDTIGELKSENEKLRMKLKVNESNLAKISSSISKEHSKMLHDYEVTLDQIKSDQNIFDKNKVKYKRYGYKLKRYCEHLRQAHGHVCSPSMCGYSIIPACPS